MSLSAPTGPPRGDTSPMRGPDESAPSSEQAAPARENRRAALPFVTALVVEASALGGLTVAGDPTRRPLLTLLLLRRRFARVARARPRRRAGRRLARRHPRRRGVAAPAARAAAADACRATCGATCGRAASRRRHGNPYLLAPDDPALAVAARRALAPRRAPRGAVDLSAARDVASSCCRRRCRCRRGGGVEADRRARRPRRLRAVAAPRGRARLAAPARAVVRRASAGGARGRRHGPRRAARRARRRCSSFCSSCAAVRPPPARRPRRRASSSSRRSRRCRCGRGRRATMARDRAGSDAAAGSVGRVAGRGAALRFLLAAVGLAAIALLPVLVAAGGVPAGLVTYALRWEFGGPLHEPLWRLLAAAHAPEAVKHGLDLMKEWTGMHALWNRAYPWAYPQLLSRLLLGVAALVLVARSALSRRPAWRDPVRGGAALFGGLLLCSPTVYPWYLLWVLPWAALAGGAAWIVGGGDGAAALPAGAARRAAVAVGVAGDVAPGRSGLGGGAVADEELSASEAAATAARLAPHCLLSRRSLRRLAAPGQRPHRAGGGRGGARRAARRAGARRPAPAAPMPACTRAVRWCRFRCRRDGAPLGGSGNSSTAPTRGCPTTCACWPRRRRPPASTPACTRSPRSTATACSRAPVLSPLDAPYAVRVDPELDVGGDARGGARCSSAATTSRAFAVGRQPDAALPPPRPRRVARGRRGADLRRRRRRLPARHGARPGRHPARGRRRPPHGRLVRRPAARPRRVPKPARTRPRTASSWSASTTRRSGSRPLR